MVKKKNNKIKNIINLGVSFFLILLGIVLVIMPWMNLELSNILLYNLFAIYAVVKLIEYLLTKTTGDYEDLFASIVCTLAAGSGFIFGKEESPLVLSLTLIAWVGLMAIIKLIKLDYYHDRSKGMLYVNLVTFVLFLLIGVLTSGNLYFEINVQTLVLGYFFIINGILNLIEDTIRIITTGGLAKISD